MEIHPLGSSLIEVNSPGRRNQNLEEKGRDDILERTAANTFVKEEVEAGVKNFSQEGIRQKKDQQPTSALGGQGIH